MIHACSDIPNDVLTLALSSAVTTARARTAAYDWNPDQFVCFVYYEVLLSVLEHTLPETFPFDHVDAFCSAAASAHSESTVTQYGRGLVRLFNMVEPYEAALGCTALLLPLSLSFAVFYVAQRFLECSANGDSIKKEFSGLVFLHAQLGFSCVLNTPLFDSAFAGYNRGLTAFSDLVGRRGFHPSTVRLVLDLALSDVATPAVIETCALLLFSYLFWFRPISFKHLRWEHVFLLPGPAIEVREVARKATGSSAAQRAESRTKIVRRQFAFSSGSIFERCLLRFFELSVKRVSSTESPLFSFSGESDMNASIQRVISAVLTLQPGFGTPEEYTIYSGRIGGLTAAKLVGATPELINQWGGWVQGGTSWAPYLRPDILFRDNPDDVAFVKSCFSQLLPLT